MKGSERVHVDRRSEIDLFYRKKDQQDQQETQNSIEQDPNGVTAESIRWFERRLHADALRAFDRRGYGNMDRLNESALFELAERAVDLEFSHQTERDEGGDGCFSIDQLKDAAHLGAQIGALISGRFESLKRKSLTLGGIRRFRCRHKEFFSGRFEDHPFARNFLHESRPLVEASGRFHHDEFGAQFRKVVLVVGDGPRLELIGPRFPRKKIKERLLNEKLTGLFHFLSGDPPLFHEEWTEFHDGSPLFFAKGLLDLLRRQLVRRGQQAENRHPLVFGRRFRHHHGAPVKEQNGLGFRVAKSEGPLSFLNLNQLKYFRQTEFFDLALQSHPRSFPVLSFAKYPRSRSGKAAAP